MDLSGEGQIENNQHTATMRLFRNLQSNGHLLTPEDTHCHDITSDSHQTREPCGLQAMSCNGTDKPLKEAAAGWVCQHTMWMQIWNASGGLKAKKKR